MQGRPFVLPRLRQRPGGYRGRCPSTGKCRCRIVVKDVLMRGVTRIFSAWMALAANSHSLHRSSKCAVLSCYLRLISTNVAFLQKCLDNRTFELWQKIVQADDIAAAELQGFEYCPSCDFGMIFEVPFNVAPLLRCLRSDCRLVSCRRCRKPVIHAPLNSTVLY